MQNPASSEDRTRASRLRRRAAKGPLHPRDAAWLTEYTTNRRGRVANVAAEVADVSREVERDNSTATPPELGDVAELGAELPPPTHREVPLRVDAQLAGVLDAGRRAAEAGVSWMERACAQFESIARIATDRAVQTERELVAALTGLADARAVELAPEDEPEEAAASGGLDEALMGELLGALRGREPVAEPATPRNT